MSRTSLLAAAASAALLALSACQQAEPEVVNAYDPQADELANAAPVELPPSIIASRTYRCRDNSLVYVTFYSNDTARIRTSENGPETTLTAEGGTPPYRAPGYSVAANADNTNITAPGKNNLSCRS